MSSAVRTLLGAVLKRTPLGLWPVRVRSGVAAGARWTLYPWTSYWRGTYEPAVQSALLALGGGKIPGWTCWDLGAHFGLYSVGLARRVGPTGQVAAFEPNPLSFARLERHQRMNALPWLKLFPAAVSNHTAGAELFTYGNPDGTTSHLPYDGETRTSAVGAIDVATLRLDDLVNSGELRPPRFIKIDIEGHGHHALAGMSETLRSFRPMVLAALHSPQELDGTLALLDGEHYACREIADKPSGRPLQVGSDYLFTPRG